MFFKAIHNSPSELYSLFKTLSSIVKTFSIKIQSDGISILQMDSAHISVIDIFIDKNDFEQFHIESEHNMVISSENLCKALSLCEKNDTIILCLKNSLSNKLDIAFSNESRKSKLSLHLIEFLDEEIQLPSIDYNVEMEISIGRFIKICKNLSQFGSKVMKITTDSKKQKINIYGNSDLGEIEITLKETEKIVKKKLNIRKKTGNNEIETKKISGKKEILINHFVKNADNVFSLEYINKILNISSLSSRLNIGMSNETPIEIQAEFFKNSYLNYYIAPKINED